MLQEWCSHTGPEEQKDFRLHGSQKGLEEQYKGSALLHGDPQALFNSKQAGLFHSGLIKTHKSNFLCLLGNSK